MGWVVNATPRPLYPRERTGRAGAEPDGTRVETRFRLSPKRTSPFNSAGDSVQSTSGSRGVRISLSNAGYTTFRGRVRVLDTHSTRQFPLHFPPCVTVCHHILNAVYPLYGRLGGLQGWYGQVFKSCVWLNSSISA